MFINLLHKLLSSKDPWGSSEDALEMLEFLINFTNWHGLLFKLCLFSNIYLHLKLKLTLQRG